MYAPEAPTLTVPAGYAAGTLSRPPNLPTETLCTPDPNACVDEKAQHPLECHDCHNPKRERVGGDVETGTQVETEPQGGSTMSLQFVYQ